MRDQQKNAPTGLRGMNGLAEYALGTNGAMRDISPSEVRRGYSAESCEDYGYAPSNSMLNTMGEEPGGFLKRDHGWAR